MVHRSTATPRWVPLVSKEQYDRVNSYLEIGKKEAKVASGGGRPENFAKGYYVQPTIFYDVTNSARISRGRNLWSGRVR